MLLTCSPAQQPSLNLRKGLCKPPVRARTLGSQRKQTRHCSAPDLHSPQSAHHLQGGWEQGRYGVTRTTAAPDAPVMCCSSPAVQQLHAARPRAQYAPMVLATGAPDMEIILLAPPPVAMMVQLSILLVPHCIRPSPLDAYRKGLRSGNFTKFVRPLPRRSKGTF